VRHCAPLEIKVVVVPEVGPYATGVAVDVPVFVPEVGPYATGVDVDVPVFVEVELAGCAAVEFKVEVIFVLNGCSETKLYVAFGTSVKYPY
jgi:hypothetical protein